MSKYIGYIQTATRVVDTRPAASPITALARARRVRVHDDVVSYCCRRETVPAPSPERRESLALADAGLSAGNEEAVKINKTNWSRRCALARCRTDRTRAKVQRGMK